jgi:hypothetical protein
MAQSINPYSLPVSSNLSGSILDLTREVANNPEAYATPSTTSSDTPSFNWEDFTSALGNTFARLGSGNMQANFPSPFNSSAPWMSTSTNGIYQPGRMDTLAGWGSGIFSGLNLLNQFQLGQEAKKNMKANRQAMDQQMKLNKATAEEAFLGRNARLAANEKPISGQYRSTQEAYDSARARTLEDMKRYGL